MFIVYCSFGCPLHSHVLNQEEFFLFAWKKLNSKIFENNILYTDFFIFTSYLLTLGNVKRLLNDLLEENSLFLILKNGKFQHFKFFTADIQISWSIMRYE